MLQSLTGYLWGCCVAHVDLPELFFSSLASSPYSHSCAMGASTWPWSSVSEQIPDPKLVIRILSSENLRPEESSSGWGGL